MKAWQRISLDPAVSRALLRRLRRAHTNSKQNHLRYASMWRLLDLAFALEVLALHKVRYLIIVIILLVFALTTLLEALVGLGELAQGCEGVRTELVENARDKLGELLVLAVAVDGEGVGRDGGVDYGRMSAHA